MAELLTQEEIDSLLTAVSSVDYQKDLSIEEFENILKDRTNNEKEIYGAHSFVKDVSINKFFDDKRSENILSDIRAKNSELKMGNNRLPGTNIELINYSICPACQTVFSYSDLMEYYSNPEVNKKIHRAAQIRLDTSVCCKNCKHYFIPSLVIVDGTPKNEMQFLCRIQTIDAIERYYDKFYKKKVLSANYTNHIRKGSKLAILNDIKLSELKKKPTLISNFLQYTPAPLIINMLEGKNVKNKDIVYGQYISKN